MAGLVNHSGRLARRSCPLQRRHFEAVKRVLKEAIQPGEVDVIPAPNEFNQAISRATAL
jgi:hypothetical protein